MYNTIFHDVNGSGIINIATASTAKYKLYGENWYTAWFIPAVDAEVPVYAPHMNDAPGVYVTCETSADDNLQIVVQFDAPERYRTFCVVQTDATSCESELVLVNQKIDTLDAVVDAIRTDVDGILTALDTANGHLTAIETNTGRIQ